MWLRVSQATHNFNTLLYCRDDSSYDQKKNEKIIDLNSNSSNMTLNLRSESQFLFILEASASLTQTIVIIDVVDVLFKYHNQDMISLDAVISSFESNICMSFKSVVSSTFIIFIELAFALLDQTSCNNKEKF